MKFRWYLTFLLLSFSLIFGALAYNRATLASYEADFTIELPSSLEDFSKISSKRGRAEALADLSPKDRSAIWKQHFEYYESKLALDSRQRDFLQKAAEFLSEDFFANSLRRQGISEMEFIKTGEGKPYRDLMEDIPRLFSKEQIGQLFLTVGDVSTITDFGCDGSLNAGGFTRTKVSSLTASCTCTGSFCAMCPDGYSCLIDVMYPCQRQPGCGCFGHFECTSECKEGPPPQ